jgi:hypothetical protein
MVMMLMPVPCARGEQCPYAMPVTLLKLRTPSMWGHLQLPGFKQLRRQSQCLLNGLA